MMLDSAKPSAKPTKRKPVKPSLSLDMSAPATAAAFRVAAAAYTKKATKTKATAVKTLHRERILTKAGDFTKTYDALKR